MGRLTFEAYAADGHVTPDDPYAQLLLDAAGRDRDAVLLVAEGADGDLVGTVTYVRPGTPLSEVSPAGRGRDPDARRLTGRPRAAGSASCSPGPASTRQGLRGMPPSSSPVRRGWLRHTGSTSGWGFARLPERDWQPRADVSLVAYGLTLGTAPMSRA